MKIAVCSKGKELDSEVDEVFGRCAYFVIVTLDDDSKEILSTESIENEAAQKAGGAGIRAAQTVVNKGAQVIIAGNFGPNAFPILSQGNVKAITSNGKVGDVIKKYLNGELSRVESHTSEEHSGMDIKEQ